MRTIFHGGRRKAGVVTLALALALMVGWIRSQSVFDQVHLWMGNTEHSLFSDRDGIAWHKSEKLKPKGRYRNPNWISFAVGVPHDNIYGAELYRGKWYGFYGNAGQIRALNGDYVSRFSMWGVSYWVMCIPLILLSAYLLLVPSRKRSPAASLPHA